MTGGTGCAPAKNRSGCTVSKRTTRTFTAPLHASPEMDRPGVLSYTLMAEPVFAMASTLSSNSKPAVRGL
jgi:hypothetical protein